jgi:hypothetical protein
MEPELQSLEQQFDAIRSDAQALASSLTDAQLAWRPAPGSWSISECLFHMVAVHRKEIGTLRRVVAEGRRKGLMKDGPFQYNFISKWFVEVMEPPPKRKFKVPKVYVADLCKNPKESLQAFLKTVDEMQQVVEEADGLDLVAIKAPSAVTRLLRMNLGARLALFASHDRRHLWQAHNVRNSPGFPQ